MCWASFTWPFLIWKARDGCSCNNNTFATSQFLLQKNVRRNGSSVSSWEETRGGIGLKSQPKSEGSLIYPQVAGTEAAVHPPCIPAVRTSVLLATGECRGVAGLLSPVARCSGSLGSGTGQSSAPSRPALRTLQLAQPTESGLGADKGWWV